MSKLCASRKSPYDSAFKCFLFDIRYCQQCVSRKAQFMLVLQHSVVEGRLPLGLSICKQVCRQLSLVSHSRASRQKSVNMALGILWTCSLLLRYEAFQHLPGASYAYAHVAMTPSEASNHERMSKASISA